MEYLVFDCIHKETGNIYTRYLYNDAIDRSKMAEIKKHVNYCSGVIKRDIESERKKPEDFRISYRIESYRTLGTHLGDYKFIEDMRYRQSENIYISPEYPTLNKVGVQPNAGWLLTGLSRGLYNK